jgi:hypothetical protein
MPEKRMGFFIFDKQPEFNSTSADTEMPVHVLYCNGCNSREIRTIVLETTPVTPL